MTVPSRLMAAALTLLCTALPARAEEPINPDAQQQPEPGAEPELKKDAPPPLEVSDAARPVLDRMRDAYAKLTGLQTSGTWAAEWDIDGETGKESAEFTSSYAAPGKFRHQTKDDLLFGSTGEKTYALKRNQYLQEDAPQSRGGIDGLPKSCAALLKNKNPSLLLAVTSDAADAVPFLADDVTVIEKSDDVSIDGVAFTSLKVATQDGADVSVLVDSATGLIRRWSVDIKRSLADRGQQAVNKAEMTIDYTSVQPEAPADPEAFVWSPPEGAKDATKMASAGTGEASALEGQPAPAFELSDLAGNKVSLDGLKGQVVVLDFWATWCGPCRAGMPILDTVAQARKDKPLKVFAVNLEEDAETIAAFVKESNLGLTVLLDSTGDTGRAYGANAIPETVIIGKDGVIRKVMVGLHPQDELENAIDEVLATK